MRFIGTHRPSIAIENDVSTSSATAARVRASVSTTSTSRMSSRMPSRPAVPSSAVRVRALVIVRVTSQASVSPNSQARVAPLGSPAAPAARTSRAPERLDRRPATSRSRDLPSSRIAWGDRRRVPSAARVR